MAIYPVTIHGRKRWRLSTSSGGNRRVQTFASRALAEAAARDAATSRASSGDWWLTLTSAERLDLMLVADEARRAGVALRKVWDEWRAQATRPAREARTLSALVDEALAAKATAGRRVRYLDNLGVVWRSFIRGREEMPVSSVTARDVEAWLSARTLSLSTRASQISRVSTLLEFAVRRGYATANPADEIEVPSQQAKPPEILTVEQCAELMEFVRQSHPRALAWFALALFAGIRPEECDRLTWDSIDLAGGTVRIDAEASKVRARRIVTLLPVASAWLRVAKAVGAEMPIPHVSRRRVLREVRDRLGFARWPQDVLRHTAASMMLSLRQDAAAVALELGNSPGVLFRHYREIVRRPDAERWAGLVPAEQ